MTKVFKTPFGALGDKQEVPIPTQTDGSVSYEQGFGIDYNRDYEDPQAKDIERENLNQLFYDLTQAVGELQQLGYMKWQAGEYQAGARVELDGKVYRAIQTTSTKPPAAGWEIVNEVSTPFTRTLLSRATAAQVRGDLGLGSSSLAELSQGVGQSGTNVMSQKAVTDALNTKTDKSVVITAGPGLSGGGSLSANRTLSVKYGTTAGTAAQGNDSRINNGQTAFGWGNHASAGYVNTSGNQSISGTKTFSSFPVTPSAAPTANYQIANKKYVDDSAFGVGQAWRDMTSSRKLGVNYTNTTGKIIFVQFGCEFGDGPDPVMVYVDDVLIINSDQGFGIGWFGSVSFVVPSGSTYQISKPVYPNIYLWSELSS